jgi:nitrate reductase cytochrome c-type subunit
MMAAAVSVQAQSDTTADKDDCQGCHEIIEAHWQESGHAKAITNTVFQQAWQEQGQPNECLACHTTGYDAETGAYEADSITLAPSATIPSPAITLKKSCPLTSPPGCAGSAI